MKHRYPHNITKTKLIICTIIVWAYSIAVGAAQQVVVKYPTYTAYYNATTKIPDSVIWIETPHAKSCGREASFHATNGRPNLARDYAHSGFDIGHNCDASDENGNKTDEYNSFDFVNTFPQTPQDNRLVWLGIENYTRSIKVPVRVKVSYMGIQGYLGVDKVAIPAACIKELWYSGHYEKFVVPNTTTVNSQVWTAYETVKK